MNTYIDSDGNRLSYNNIDMEKCEYLIVLKVRLYRKQIGSTQILPKNERTNLFFLLYSPEILET